MPTPFAQQLIDFGMQTGQGLLGGGMGLLFGKANDRRQLKQAEKLQALEMKGAMQMGEYNYGKQMQLWKDTNYRAQMEELTKAGLNPGLIYGMGGGGGQTASTQPGRVQGQSAPQGGGEITAMATNAMQLGLLRAQKENIEADTANKKADIPVKEATKPKLEAETKSLLQGIENAKAQEQLTKVQTDIQRVAARIAESTEDSAGEIIRQDLAKIEAEARSALVQANVDEDTKEQKIEMIKEELVGQTVKNALTRAQTGLTTVQILEAERKIINMYQENIRQWRQLELNERQLGMEISKQIDEETGLPKEISSFIGGIIGGILTGKAGQSIPPIRGLHKRN